MKIIKPTFEITEQKEGLQGIYEQVELAGRTCYKSDPTYTYYKRHKNNNIVNKTPITEEEYNKLLEDSNTKDSVFKDSINAKDFVDRMIKSGHGAMLEHGTVYLNISPKASITGYKYRDNHYSKYVGIRDKNSVRKYITTNLRVLVENNWLDDLKYLCEPTKYHEKRVTVKFYTQIAVTREFNRHRVNSIAEQSTRYCDYSKDKFNGVAINLPSFIHPTNSQYIENICNDSNVSLINYCKLIADNNCDASFIGMEAIDYWLFANLACEFSYLKLLKLGMEAQNARTVLPLDTNTELIHTAFISDWEHFFDLRALGTTGTPHPDAKLLARPLMEEFNKRFKK